MIKCQHLHIEIVQTPLALGLYCNILYCIFMKCFSKFSVSQQCLILILKSPLIVLLSRLPTYV